MTEPRVTIVVVPRERFSVSRRSLDSLYEHTSVPFKLVYVDGRSPRYVRRDIAARAREREFRVIRTSRYVSPNEARNIGLRETDTPYVVFIDNDAVVSPGWLEAMVRCAEETDAWVVAPVYGIGEPAEGIIHLAGGFVEFREDDGRRHFRETHRFSGKRLADIRPRLRREAIDFGEFHCMLVRRSAFELVGELDERLLTAREHLDFCLAVRQAGGRVYLEPEALVTYIAPPPFAWSDLPYFLLRWSDDWNRDTLEYVRKKWGLADDDPHAVTEREWLRHHRWIALARPARAIRRVLGWRLGSWVLQRSLIPAEGLVTRWLVRRAARERAAGQPLRVSGT